MLKFSVIMPARNHDKYIPETLGCVLMQEVDFDYEIVAGEDRSTDKTRAIIYSKPRRRITGCLKSLFTIWLGQCCPDVKKVC